MSGNDEKVMEMSSSPPLWSVKIENDTAYELSPTVLLSSSSEKMTSTGTPIRHIVCLKNAGDVKRFEETEDCFILDFDPIEPINLVKLFDDDENEAPEISIVAEKGQAACRDYPHSRHLCVKFPFETTTHESHCDLCYCYVCDSPAPCAKWRDFLSAHCNASEKIESWKIMRTLKQGQMGSRNIPL